MAKSNKNAAVDPNAFKAALASSADACAAMDFSGQNWVPPVGTYAVSINDVTMIQKPHGFGLKPLFEIVDEDSEFFGRTFTDFMWHDPSKRELTPGLRQMLYLATCLAAREVRDPSEAFDIINGAVGECIEIERKDNPGKGKNAGKVFENIVYKNRLESVVEEATS